MYACTHLYMRVCVYNCSDIRIFIMEMHYFGYEHCAWMLLSLIIRRYILQFSSTYY